MKAIMYEQFGPPEVLKLVEIDKPKPKDDEVLIKIHATAVNFGDILTRNFKEVSPRQFNMPFLFWILTKVFFGFRKPKKKILGNEFAGEIESVGKNVTKFREGDSVFGYSEMNMGAYAEYICMGEDGMIAPKPSNMSYEEAATVSGNATTALNLLKKVDIKKGHKVLVNGASGGIGSILVQLAKNADAKVTGVCGTPRMGYIKELGADHVIDYTKEDFTESEEKYDLVIDILGKSSFSKGKKVLKEKGIYLYASFKLKQLLQMLRTSIIGKKKVKCVLTMAKPEDQMVIKELVEAGKLKSIVDKVFPMEQAVEAHKYMEKGFRKGAVVVTWESKNQSEKVLN